VQAERLPPIQEFNSGTIFGGNTMKAMKKSMLAATLVGAFGFSSSASAGIIIDLFTDPVGSSQSVSTETLGATVNNQGGPFPVANVIGQYRDLSINKTFDNVGSVDVGASTMTAGGGALQLDNATGNKSIGVVTWDGINNAGAGGTSVNTTGLGGVDLTTGGADRFLAQVIAADLGFDYKIKVWDIFGNSSILSASVQFQLNPPGEASDYLFSWFNLASGTYCDGIASPPTCVDPTTQLDFSILHTGGAIDFTKIGALQIEFTNPSTISVDLAIGTIQTPTVPEPGALALVGIALLGATVAGGRRKSPKV
jgi:hypothetical protein